MALSLLEDRARGETGGFEPQLMTQGGVETKGQKGHENMGSNAVLLAMKDRAHGEIALKVFKASSICVSNM